MGGGTGFINKTLVSLIQINNDGDNDDDEGFCANLNLKTRLVWEGTGLINKTLVLDKFKLTTMVTMMKMKFFAPILI